MTAKFPTFLVGGALRDEFLGITPKDNDYVVLAPSFDAMREQLLGIGCKIFLEKPEHLTIRANHPTLGAVDFACGRKDGEYTDGRRPDSTSVTTELVEDLSRRDFTCNAMARNVETGELHDPFNGREDIRKRDLCAVGDPKKRLGEDRLRAFRALRFCVTKRLNITPNLANAMHWLTVDDFSGVSPGRIREEMMRMLKHNTFGTFTLLLKYPTLCQVVNKSGLWFKPTLEAK